MVMCTHLHVDHVGWNTQLENGKWVPTFKNAKYVWSRADYDHYLKLDSDPKTGPANAGSFRDSVLPVVEAGLMQMVDGAAQLDENMSVTPAPGHTPGTIAIKFESRARRRCSAATSCIMRCRSIIRSGTASPAPSPSARARAGARRSSIAPARARG